MKKLGFTLAEVLVTLLIIGVVAALAIPRFVTNAHNQTNAAKMVTIATDYENIFGMMMMKENKSSIFKTEFGRAWFDNDATIMKNALLKYTQVARTGTNTSNLGYLSYNMVNPLVPAAFADATVSKSGSSKTVTSNTLSSEGKYPCAEGKIPFYATTVMPEGYDCTYNPHCDVAGTVPCFCCVPKGDEKPCPTNYIKVFRDEQPWQGCVNGNFNEADKEFWCCPQEGPCPNGEIIYTSGTSQNVPPKKGCKIVSKGANQTGWCCEKPSSTNPCEGNTAGYTLLSTTDTGNCVGTLSISSEPRYCCKDPNGIDPSIKEKECVGQGGHWIVSTQECRICKPGEFWNEGTLKCDPKPKECEGGYIDENGACRYCSKSQYYDAEQKKCVPYNHKPETPDTPDAPDGTPIHTITNGNVTTEDFNFVLGATTAEGGANVFFGAINKYTGTDGKEHQAATIYIDANGSITPNKFGRDVFAFVLNEDGHLYPYGSEKAAMMLNSDKTWKTEDEKLGCTGNKYKGLGCTGRITENNNKVDY